jgi:signal peptidase complex subunit 3
VIVDDIDHWDRNVHQIFLYVVALYETDDRQKNQVVLWDKIVRATDSDRSKMIDEQNIFVKYALVDQGQKLRGNLIHLQLQWDLMPITGVITMDRQPMAGTTNFTLPLEYK